MKAALIMAGGAGARMGAAVPKPLVPVLGLPMIERNLLALIAHGFDDITVATRRGLPALAEYLDGRGAALARAAGVALRVHVEATPLGTLGAAGLIAGAGPVLVVNADNLVGFDLTAFLAHHVARGAAMTVACHDEPFQIPFGAVDIADGRVVAVREKPVLPVPISSGTYVLSPPARALCAERGQCGAPSVMQALIDRGDEVAAWRHQGPWIDVNTHAAVGAATSLLQQHASAMERFWREPDVVVVGAVLRGAQGVLLEHRPASASSYPSQWDTPGGKVEPNEAPTAAIYRELDEELGLTDVELRPLTTFDDLDPHSRRRFRHHVYVAELTGPVAAREAQTLGWFPSVHGLATPALRALAYLERRP